MTLFHEIFPNFVVEMKKILSFVRRRLANLSYRTGLVVVAICVACYIISFAQMLLPIPAAWKGGLWVAFYGLAKATQYTAILILGKEGWMRLKARFVRRTLQDDVVEKVVEEVTDDE